MSYDWWARWDRLACRIGGHSWLDHQCEWLGSPAQFSTCIRCGANAGITSKGRHRAVRA